MSQFSFPINPALTAIAMAYRNPDQVLIADKVLPRIDAAQAFKWTKYDLAQGYTVPNTRVAPKSEPNMVDFKGVEMLDQTFDYGLDDLIDNGEIEAWLKMPKPETGGPLSPEAISTMYIMGLVKLDREVRVANAVFNAAVYPAGNQATLSGTSQWSDQVNSNPLTALLGALDTPVIRPNKMAIGRQAWTQLRSHPKIAQAVNASAQTAGAASLQSVADLLELKEIIVGDAFVNTARKGQAYTMSRTWGKHCLLYFSSEQAAKERQPVFGFTAQFGTSIAGEIPAPVKGLRGGKIVRAGESVKEVISAPDAAYYFQNAVA